MQTIYVLLRHDKQTGPYSLEEIVQFDLKPYDLIWIEGKSAGWYYPQEIAALHPYLSFLPQQPKPAPKAAATAENRVFVTMPVVPKQEEPPAPQPFTKAPTHAPEEAHKPLASDLNNFEEAVYAQFVKPAAANAPVAATPVATQRKVPARSVGVAIATVLVVGGVFAASWIMNRHSGEEETAVETVAETPVQNEMADTAVAKNNSKKSIFASNQKRQKNSVATRQTTKAAKQTAPQKQDQQMVAGSPADETNDLTTTTPPKEEEPVVTKEEMPTAPAQTTEAPQEKKKKLREKILDLFKKKPQEEKAEEAKPAETEGGERRATRREDGASLAQMVHVRFDVPNDWMMGIRGAKATLVNRSSETVAKAVVEVLYYDDDNQLLQKKVIAFSRVESKDSQSLSIPDHSSATRVDYNLVSVTGKPGA